MLTILAIAPGCTGREPARPNLVLVTLDTTRFDALGFHRAAPSVTPRLDELAREALVFDSARSVAPLTLPAHASMLTGLYPPRHTVRDNGLSPLPESAQTAGEVLSAAGYETAAFVSAAVLDRSWGLGQGFDHFDAPEASDPSAPGIHIEERSGDETTGRFLRWFEERNADAPFFAWVHFFDPHAPYEPPEKYLEQAHGDAYLGEVAAMDASIGRLLDALKLSGVLARTVLIVVADHGESLGQHRESTHSIFCYEPTIHVPLLVRWPEGRRGGERSGETVSVVDVFPTLLAAAGLAIPPGIDGIDLGSIGWAGERQVYFESYCGWLNYSWSPLCGLTNGRQKYLWSGLEELYDLDLDPREKSNLASRRTDECAGWKARLEKLSSRPGLHRSVADIDPSQRARIRNLGYSGAADPEVEVPSPLTNTELPSPAQCIEELQAYYAALEADQAGRRSEAIEGLHRLLARNPRNYAAGDILGALLLSEGRHEAALVVLRGLQTHGRERVTTHLSLAQCLVALGREQEALLHRLRAVELHPRGVLELAALAESYDRLGDAVRAAEVRSRLADRDVSR